MLCLKRERDSVYTIVCIHVCILDNLLLYNINYDDLHQLHIILYSSNVSVFCIVV